MKNILITGKRNTGKTTTALFFANYLELEAVVLDASIHLKGNAAKFLPCYKDTSCLIIDEIANKEQFMLTANMAKEGFYLEKKGQHKHYIKPTIIAIVSEACYNELDISESYLKGIFQIIKTK